MRTTGRRIAFSMVFLVGASLASAQNVWEKRVSGGNGVTAEGNQVCVDSMNRGSAYAVRNRPYVLGPDYSVGFEFRLNTSDNHGLVAYFDGFIYLNVDWGTELKYWNDRVPGVLGKLEEGRWYRVKIEAQPSRKTFDVFLDGVKVGSAVGVEPGKRTDNQPSPQDVSDGAIMIGDFESTDYKRGRGCWKNFSLPSAGRTADVPVARDDKTPILDGVWNYQSGPLAEIRNQENGSWVFKTKPKILVVEWWLDFELRTFGQKARETVTYDLSWTGNGAGFIAVYTNEKGGKSVIEAKWTDRVNLEGRYYSLYPGQSVPDRENTFLFFARRVSDDPRAGGR